MSDLENAIVSVREHVDAAGSREWFELVCDTYADNGDWSGFRDTLVSQAGGRSFGGAAEVFLVFLDGVSGPIDVVKEMSERRDSLPGLYEDLLGGAEPETAAEPAGTDEEWDVDSGATWYAQLTEDGSGWSGAEEHWDQFEAYFRYRAEERGVPHGAATFLEYVKQYDDKADGFAAYGITIDAADDVEADDEAPTEEQLAEWKAEDPLSYHWFPAQDGTEAAWRVWSPAAGRFVTEDEVAELAADEDEAAEVADALPPEVVTEIADQVMAPAIANAIAEMAADPDFSAEDIAAVLDEAQNRLAQQSLA
jgi:hypothetical protein